jgi:copper oxidase (laccase) domain-containing protein
MDMAVAVGPSIGPCCYTVGEEVWSEFGRQFSYAEELFIRTADTGEIRLNLWEANRRQLLNAGVAEANIAMMGECTACARGQNAALRYFRTAQSTELRDGCSM